MTLINLKCFLLSFSLLFAHIPYEIQPDDKIINMEEWTSGVRLSVNDVYLIPEVNTYPLNPQGIRFTLKNNSDEDYDIGIGTTLIKYIAGQWYVVPIQGQGVFFETYMTEGRSNAHSETSILLDVEVLYGTLGEGEYALVLNLYSQNLRLPSFRIRHYVKGYFAVSEDDYDEVETNIALRPMRYSIEHSSIAGYPSIMFIRSPMFEFTLLRMVDYDYVPDPNVFVPFPTRELGVTPEPAWWPYSQ